MTEPCVDPAFFDSPAGVLSPQRRWTREHRGSAEAGGATFTPASNPSPGTVLFTVQVQWTNTTGVSQRIDTLMTQGPVRYSIDGLKHLVIRYRWAFAVGVAPADPTTFLPADESRVRGMVDIGTGSVGGTAVATYVLMEDRHPAGSIAIGDILTVPAGQMIKARCQVSWQTDAWGLNWAASIGGDPVPYRIGKVGPVRLDLFSTPVIP